MTARQIFEGLLTETNKVNAPTLLLSDFNYFINKAINLIVNKNYNIYDTNLQTTDSLRVLKATAKLEVTDDNYIGPDGKNYGHYRVILPDDYLHMLNCICVYNLEKSWKCYDAEEIPFPAKKLTADSWSAVINDYYNRPKPERPYYYIHNSNGPESTAKSTATTESIERHTNPSLVQMEIRYGKDNSVFKLKEILVDYIKAPLIVNLTYDQVNHDEDSSQIMEFPDVVCQEIINELVLIVLENVSDPRILTHHAVSQSIASPTQQLAKS